MLKKRIAIYCLLLFISLMIALLMILQRQLQSGSSTIYSQEANSEYRKEKDKIANVIKVDGPEVAYEVLRKDYDLSSNKPIFHNVTHFLGAKLYEYEGPRGLIVCDETAGYGCFHGFIASTLSDKGKSFLGSIETFCQDKTDSIRSIECIHGIGHGLLATTDYSLQNLISTLKDCDLVSKKDFLINICYSGVFMEYNIRTMRAVNNQGFSVRDFDPSNPYDPCHKLTDHYQLRCYYELPYWWLPITNSNFNLMGKWCLAINDKGNREECFRGIGHVVPWAVRYDETETVKGCNRLPYPENKALCIEDAIKRLFYRNGEKSLNLCNYVDSNLKISCLKDSKEFMCTNLLICDAK